MQLALCLVDFSCISTVCNYASFDFILQEFMDSFEAALTFSLIYVGGILLPISLYSSFSSKLRLIVRFDKVDRTVHPCSSLKHTKKKGRKRPNKVKPIAL